jgi:hypothetical protein
MKKILLTLILGIFLIGIIGMVSASEQYLGTVKQGDCFDLKMPCSNCTFVNITAITYPNGSTFSVNAIMNDIGGGIYILNTCSSSSDLGHWIYDTKGDPDGILISQPVGYDVTPSGIIQSSILNNPILIILLAISILFLIIALYNTSYPLGFISGIMFTLSGIYTMIYGFNNYTDDYTRAVGLVLIGLGTIFVLASSYEWIKDAGDDNGAYIGKAEDKEEEFEEFK